MTDLWSGTYKNPRYWGDTAAALIATAELHPGSTVLDLGTGYGGTLFPVRERIGDTGRMVGIDVEAECVEWTRQEIATRGIGNVEVLLMDARSMSFPDACFDVIVAGMVGLDEDYDFDANQPIDGAPMIREMLRILKAGGRLYLSGWLWQEHLEWMAQLVRQFVPDSDKHGYFPTTREGYLDLLRGSGFERIHTTSFDERYTFDDPAAWMAVVRHSWEPELSRIQDVPARRRAFENAAFDLLAAHTDAGGRLAYRISALLVAAQKPAAGCPANHRRNRESRARGWVPL